MFLSNSYASSLVALHSLPSMNDGSAFVEELLTVIRIVRAYRIDGTTTNERKEDGREES